MTDQIAQLVQERTRHLRLEQRPAGQRGMPGQPGQLRQRRDDSRNCHAPRGLRPLAFFAGDFFAVDFFAAAVVFAACFLGMS